MNDARQIIPLTGLLATIALSGYLVVQLHAQNAAPPDNLRTAAFAEVHDTQGQILLRGPFADDVDTDGDLERKARLEPAGADTDASGEAEIEMSRNATAQEVEFSVRQLEPGTAVLFLIDGQEVGRATVDRLGRAEIEVEFTAPGASRSTP